LRTSPANTPGHSPACCGCRAGPTRSPPGARPASRTRLHAPSHGHALMLMLIVTFQTSISSSSTAGCLLTRERDEGVGVARHLRLALVHARHGPHLAHRLPGDLKRLAGEKISRGGGRPAEEAERASGRPATPPPLPPCPSESSVGRCEEGEPTAELAGGKLESSRRGSSREGRGELDEEDD